MFVAKNEMILLGDFNVNFLEKGKHRRSWRDVVSLISLDQLITGPTRGTEISRTYIDHANDRNPSYIANSGVMEYGLSDH